jgi:pilus assembly protein CpaE
VIKPAKDSEFAIDFDADDDFLTATSWEAEAKTEAGEPLPPLETLQGEPDFFSAQDRSSPGRSLADDLYAAVAAAAAEKAEADIAAAEARAAAESAARAAATIAEAAAEAEAEAKLPAAPAMFEPAGYDDAADPFRTVPDNPSIADPFLSPLPATPPPSMAAQAGPAEPAPDPFADLHPMRGPDDLLRERQVLEEPAFVPAAGEPMGAGLAGLADQGAAGELAAPRIAIHIFCDRPETAQAAEAAAGDRRMSRASTVVQPGGLAGAVVYYQNQPTPSLIIVESGDPAPVLVGLLDQLAEVCDPGTKVIVIGRSNDIALYRELMKRGVSEYLVPPIQPLQIIQSITTLYTDPSAPFIGRSIAFVGAKGGVGSSTIAHNFAHALTEYMQSHAVVVDFDLPFGTAGLDFNQDPLQGVADALTQPDRLDPVLLERMMVRCTDRLSLFAAPATLDDDYDISAEAFEEVAAKIRTTAPFVVLDLPHLWSGWMRRTLLGCEEVVIVAVPDLASLRNAKNMIDLIRHARPNDQPPRLVLNQVGVPGRPEIPVKDFAQALGVEPSVIINFEPKLFGQAANNGQMISETGPKSKASDSVNQLAQIISRREPPPQPKKSLFAGLLKK